VHGRGGAVDNVRIVYDRGDGACERVNKARGIGEGGGFLTR